MTQGGPLGWTSRISGLRGGPLDFLRVGAGPLGVGGAVVILLNGTRNRAGIAYPCTVSKSRAVSALVFAFSLAVQVR